MFAHLEGIEVIPVEKLEEVLQMAVIKPATTGIATEARKPSMDLIPQGNPSFGSFAG